MEVLLFNAGGCRLGLVCSEIAQLIHLPALTLVPETPRAILGFFRLGENVVPVLRPDVLMGLNPLRIRRSSPLIILRQQPTLALLVDELEEVVSVQPTELAPLDYADSLHGCAAASLSTAAGRACLLSAARLLGFEESQRIHELQTRAEERLASLE